MKERIGAILATATVLSGCEQDWSDILDQNPLSPPPTTYSQPLPGEQRPTLVTVEPPETTLITPPVTRDTESQIQTDILPKVLPPAIRDQIESSIKISNDVYYLDGQGYRHSCGGVQIDEYHFLSAGHCDMPNDFTRIIFDCQEPTIKTDQPLDIPVVEKVVDAPFALNNIASANDNDILLYKTSAESDSSRNANLHDQDPKVGEGDALYSVSYQPTLDGRDRDPNPSTLSEKDRLDGLGTPSILGMIALGQYDKDTVWAITADKAYSNPPETLIRRGASGSPVYDDEGRLVGIISSMASEYTSIAGIERYIKKEIIGLDDSTPATIVFIKNTSSDKIGQLKSELEPVRNCDI